MTLLHYFIGGLSLASMASPAAAQWDAAAWGMSVEEVIAAVGGDTAAAKDKKDKRILKQRRLATGTHTEGDIGYEVSYYFDKKSKTLTMILFVPLDRTGQCDAALEQFQEMLGRVEVEDKTLNLSKDTPNLYTSQAAWPGGERGGLVEYSSASIEFSDYRHCQFLFQQEDFSEK